jgi:hypothetical protein
LECGSSLPLLQLPQHPGLNLKRANEMETNNQAGANSWLHSVLTDIQFWVPVAVLIGGLLLLHSLH